MNRRKMTKSEWSAFGWGAALGAEAVAFIVGCWLAHDAREAARPEYPDDPVGAHERVW